MTAEETIASLEAQLKQALERLNEVTEQLRAVPLPDGGICAVDQAGVVILPQWIHTKLPRSGSLDGLANRSPDMVLPQTQN